MPFQPDGGGIGEGDEESPTLQKHLLNLDIYVVPMGIQIYIKLTQPILPQA